MNDTIKSCNELIDLRELTNRTIEQYCQSNFSDSLLHQACHYALTSGGKRVRPILTMIVSKGFGGSYERSLPAAVAIEFIHSYSLVHDDLPAFDNDDMRRGKPTVHIAFDEPEAILVGDAILTEAWRILSHGIDTNETLTDETRLKIISTLSNNAGLHGMILGQSLDKAWNRNKNKSLEKILEIHSLKTGKLLGTSCRVGALCSCVTDCETLEAIENFGRNIGLAFQITDDLLDQVNIAQGESKAKVETKPTILEFLDANAANKLASDLTEEAFGFLKSLSFDANLLIQFCSALLKRRE